jgi:hypothetical protein
MVELQVLYTILLTGEWSNCRFYTPHCKQENGGTAGSIHYTVNRGMEELHVLYTPLLTGE